MGRKQRGLGSLHVRGAVVPAVVAVVVAVVVWLVPVGPAGAQAVTDEVSPATLYVGPGGNDAADGQTVASAWQSLGAALRRVGPGQTLYVLNGTYRQPRCGHCGAHFRLAPGDRGVTARADAPIRVLAHPGHQPEIVADRGTGIEVVGSYLELSGFRIRGEGFSPTNSWGFGIMAERGHHVRLADNIVSGFPKSGINANRASGVSIEGNVVYHNAWWSTDADSGISLHWPENRGVGPGPDGYTDRVVGNVVFGNENRVPTPAFAPPGLVSDGNGIIVDETAAAGYTGRILVMNNVAVANGGKGINIYKSANVDVLHNTLVANGFTTNMYGTNGDLSVGRSSAVRVLNNLVQTRPDRASLMIHGSSDVDLRANVVSGGLAPGPGVDRSANVFTSAVAGFVAPGDDPRSADLRLAAGSVAIDRGTADAVALPLDRDGRARMVGAAPDAGAHEHQGARSATPAPGQSAPGSPPAPAPAAPPAQPPGPAPMRPAGRSVVGIAAGPKGTGYVVVHADGTVVAHGGARHHGDLAGTRLNRPVVGVAVTASGSGYWLIAADGGVFAFGDARFHGSTGAMRLNAPVVALSPTPTGAGYWLLATDGGVFSFGDARFHGSMGGVRLNRPVNGMVPTSSGQGYRMVAADGGVFAFGDAAFYGSTGAEPLPAPVVAMAGASRGNGYWLLLGDGRVRPFGAASHLGDATGRRSVAIAANPGAVGYRILLADGATAAFGAAP